MSVCIRIEGSDGKWWQRKTMFCIQNKQNPCFRWQRMAILCIHFLQNKESGCKDQESKAISCIPKHRETGFGMQSSRIKDENLDSETRKKKVLMSKKWSSETEPHLLIFSGNHALLNMSLPTPQTGQTQSSGRFSKAVPGAIPLSGSPTAGSYSYPHASQTYLSM